MHPWFIPIQSASNRRSRQPLGQEANNPAGQVHLFARPGTCHNPRILQGTFRIPDSGRGLQGVGEEWDPGFVTRRVSHRQETDSASDFHSMANDRQGDQKGGPTLTDWLVYIVARIAMSVVQALPIETCERVSHGLAVLCWQVLRIRRDVTEENLRHAFPQLGEAERQQLGLQMWENILLMMCEVAHVPRKLHDTNWRQYVRISDADMSIFIHKFMDPRPLVTVSGHFGNFEVAGVLGGLMGFPTFAVTPAG